MDQKTKSIFFALLRSAICGTSVTEEKKEEYSVEYLPNLLRYAKQHDIAHLIGMGLYQNGWLDRRNVICEKLQQEQMLAVCRYEKLNFDLESLCRVFEDAEIPFLPLKGSVLRRYYREAWMRTSCDIDILIQKEDVERASAILSDACGYIRTGESAHDISFFSPAQTHLELHYQLIETQRANAADDVLQNVWDSTVLCDGYHFWHRMTDEWFYFYHVAHMAKHFENGGCGIKPVMDLWVLDRMENVDQERRDQLLDQGGLLKFAQAVRRLSRIWFDSEASDPLSQQMENYILHGGVYGTDDNRILFQQKKKGGRIRYLCSRIFLPYDKIKFYYPILQKHRWLTPIMEIHRWLRVMFCGRTGQTLWEIKFAANVTEAESQKAQEFLENIGLGKSSSL